MLWSIQPRWRSLDVELGHRQPSDLCGAEQHRHPLVVCRHHPVRWTVPGPSSVGVAEHDEVAFVEIDVGILHPSPATVDQQRSTISNPRRHRTKRTAFGEVECGVVGMAHADQPPNLRAPESAANVRCARLPKECCHSIRPRVTAAQRRSGVRLQGMRIAEIGHSTRSTRSRERGFCQRTTRSGSGFDQRCRHRRTSATSPPSIWSASPTAPACPPTNGRTAAVQHSAADPARTRRPATFATPIRSCSASATTSANVGNTVRTAASGRPDRDRTAIERPSRLTHADLVEFSAPEPATVPTMGLLAVTVVAIAAARR